MAIKPQSEVPASLQRVCRRFERWRNSHRGRVPIPERLWASAAEVAREQGVFRTAKVLHLEYGKLKRMVAAGSTLMPTAPAPTTTFLELMPSPTATASAECVVELEGPRGKMRIQWKGTTAPDLAGLSRAFWESA